MYKLHVETPQGWKYPSAELLEGWGDLTATFDDYISTRRFVREWALAFQE